MSKKNWPDHPAIGLSITYTDGDYKTVAEIIDVKAGPMLASWGENSASADISGTLKLRVKTEDGRLFWTAPCDGEGLVKWAEKQRDAAAIKGVSNDQ